MQFNSIHFIIFFIIIITTYFLINYKYRWIILLIGSYYFYMCWKPEYVFLIIFSTLIDYFCALKMGSYKNLSDRKPYLLISILSNLGILFFFKYFNFFNQSFKDLFNYFNIFYNATTFDILLPVGISFYTFQTLSYSIDVYRGNKKPETHLGIFAVYVSFFPQLVAGPIEKSTHFLPQLNKNHNFNYIRFKEGLLLMLWGFFKKIVIADRLAVLVNTVYNNPSDYQGIALIIATIFFAFQIYCDFSAYSDIAIGSARIMGYDLVTNFNLPYLSKSISEFWRRWHISLGAWFKEYLYLPLGGNRGTLIIKIRNIIIVFLISGLWHGANWTFIIWGGLHSIYMIFELFFQKIKNKTSYIYNFFEKNRFYNLLQVLFTFILVDFAWIFFRANSIQDAIYIIKNLFIIDLKVLSDKSLHKLGLDEKDLYLSILLIIFLIITQSYQKNKNIINWVLSRNIILRWTIYFLAIYSIFTFGYYAQGNQSQFIYFQF